MGNHLYSIFTLSHEYVNIFNSTNWSFLYIYIVNFYLLWAGQYLEMGNVKKILLGPPVKGPFMNKYTLNIRFFLKTRILNIEWIFKPLFQSWENCSFFCSCWENVKYQFFGNNFLVELWHLVPRMSYVSPLVTFRYYFGTSTLFGDMVVEGQRLSLPKDFLFM